jgi:hypothetical protein
MQTITLVRWHLAIAGIVVGLFSAPAVAQEPADSLRVASLIRQLGSESYPERTKAHHELAKLGGLPREQLQEALKHAEPEVRLRAKELLKRLQVDDLWSASHIALDGNELKAGEVISQLSTQTGNRVLLGDQYAAFNDQPIKLTAGRHDFWPLLDTICAQTGNRVRPHYDTRQPGLVAIVGQRPQYPVTYTGPVRATITSARRDFKEEFDYERRTSDVHHAFLINLQFMWEERFRLVAYRSQPELIGARTDTGVELTIVQPASPTWSVASNGSRQVSMSLRLQPPPVSAARLASLDLRWGLVAVGDLATIEIASPDMGKAKFQDDVHLAIESCLPSDGGRCELIVTVNRDVLVTEPQDVFFQEHDLLLVDQHGREYRQQSQSHSVNDAGVRLKVTYTGDSTDSEPAKMVFRYPRIRAQRALDLKFVDVPLPVAKPE